MLDRKTKKRVKHSYLRVQMLKEWYDEIEHTDMNKESKLDLLRDLAWRMRAHQQILAYYCGGGSK